MWIDSHCHLNHEKNAEGDSPASIIERAKAAGVNGMLTVCCEIDKEFEDLLSLANTYDNLWCSIGTHPHEAVQDTEIQYTASDIADLAKKNPKVIGIGESGLDYYYNHSPKDEQQTSFRKHIQACLEADLPLIVHARDADEDIVTILQEENQSGRLKGLMHCFSSTQYLADKALEMGFYISFSGIVTFKKAQELRDIAKTVSLDRILVETDSPYLAPEPYRGKVNEPAHVVHTGRCLAEIHNVSEEEIAKHSTQNFFDLFQTARLT